jgi:hypothetical protein
MKKPNQKKLTLHRETVGQLSAELLQEVQAGGKKDSDCCPSTLSCTQ